MLRERNDIFLIIFILVDILSALFAFWLAFGLRFIFPDGGDFDHISVSVVNYVSFSLIILLSQPFVFYFVGLYQPGRIGASSDDFPSIVLGVIVVVLIAVSGIFFFRTYRYSRIVILFFAFLDIIVVSIIRSALRRLLRVVMKGEKRLRGVIIVGAGQTAVRVTELLSNQTMFGYRVDGFLSVMHEPVEAGINCIGSIDDLRELIRKLQPYHVIFALDSTDYQSLDLAIEICDEEGVHLHVVPDYSELITNRGRLESLGGIPLITVRDIPSRRGFNRLLKRSFDIVFSSIFIVVFSPIFFLLILLIKLTSKGPVFYTQERVGLDNKVFNIIKFRTMFVQEKSQSDKVWTTQNDPRVTSIGRFMRKLSLDETPQFINVITGKMSVVGPRPERPYWVEQFKDTYHHYMQRHAVKAGITGWAQVNGFRGDTSIEQRVTADIYYIENWSFLLDLKIVLMTPFKSVIDRNAY